MTHSQDSKLANVLMTFELQRRLVAAGLPITANALHPGFIPNSDFLRNMPCCVPCLMRFCCGFLCRPCNVTQTVANGEACETYAAAGVDADVDRDVSVNV